MRSRWWERSCSIRPPIPRTLNARIQPIELAFSKLATLLRKAAPRSVEELWTVIAELLDQFPPRECRKFFERAGYDRYQS